MRPVAASTPPLDTRGFIGAHTPCIKCRYELRGLKPDGICPECGTPVAASITGSLLRCVPLPLLIRLRTGVRLALGGYACYAVYYAVAATLPWLAWVFFRATGISMAQPLCAVLIGLVLSTGAFVLLSTGALVIASHHSPNSKSDPALARGVFAIISFCMILSAAILLLAPLRPVAFSGAASFGTSALFFFSFGIMGAGLCWHVGKIIGSYGLKHLPTAGKRLAIFFGLCGTLRSLVSLAFADRGTRGPDDSIIFLWRLGLLCTIASIAGILVFLPLVLRVVSAELKIAKGWAKPPEPLTCPPADGAGLSESEAAAGVTEDGPDSTNA